MQPHRGEVPNFVFNGGNHIYTNIISKHSLPHQRKLGKVMSGQTLDCVDNNQKI